MWDSDYKHRPSISGPSYFKKSVVNIEELHPSLPSSGFLKDDLIGLKRLTSMPDRITNTINAADGVILTRPSVINCYYRNGTDDGNTDGDESIEGMLENDVHTLK